MVVHDVTPDPSRRGRAVGAILDVVPIVAVLFGIVILMFYKEHEPAPFHAEHQGQHAKFDFDGKVAAR
jgi:hypothetical protein